MKMRMLAIDSLSPHHTWLVAVWFEIGCVNWIESASEIYKIYHFISCGDFAHSLPFFFTVLPHKSLYCFPNHVSSNKRKKTISSFWRNWKYRRKSTKPAVVVVGHAIKQSIRAHPNRIQQVNQQTPCIRLKIDYLLWSNCCFERCEKRSRIRNLHSSKAWVLGRGSEYMDDFKSQRRDFQLLFAADFSLQTEIIYDPFYS